jgi:hypothetical protein
MPDTWEDDNGLDKDDPDDAASDNDDDGLTNLEEYHYGTDPNNADTDGGGIKDGDEVARGTDPLDASDDMPYVLPTKVVEPANFLPSYLRISPQQVSPNQPVEISINIANQGDESGSHTVSLSINGNVEHSKTVSVSPGSTKNVVFTVTKSTPGSYSVSVEGQGGQFIVVGGGMRIGGGLGTGGIIAIVIAVMALITTLVFILRGRSEEI